MAKARTTRGGSVDSKVYKVEDAPTPITGISEDEAVLIDAALTHLLENGLFGHDTEAARTLRQRVIKLTQPRPPIFGKLRARS